MDKYFDLSRKGSVGECIAFYFIFLLLAFLLGCSIGAVSGVIFPNDAANISMRCGHIAIMVASPIIAALMISKKKLWLTFRAYLLLFLSLIGAAFFGAILSCVFLAIIYGLSPNKQDGKEDAPNS